MVEYTRSPYLTTETLSSGNIPLDVCPSGSQNKIEKTFLKLASVEIGTRDAVPFPVRRTCAAAVESYNLPELAIEKTPLISRDCFD